MSETSPRGSRASKAEADEPEVKTSESEDPQASATAADEPVDHTEEHSEIPVSQLVEQSSEFLGYPSHTAMGALSDSLDQEMTPADAKAKVEDWLNKPVEVDEGKE